MFEENYMEKAKRLASHSEDEYTEYFAQKVESAWMYYKSGMNVLKIEEDGIEKHIEVIWNKNDDNLHSFVEEWNTKAGTEPTVLVGPSGAKTYLLDFTNIVTCDPDDEMYFYRVGSCLPVIVEIEKDGKKLLVGNHVRGELGNKDLAISVFLKLLEKTSKIKKVTVLYNSYGYGKPSEEGYARLAEEYDFKLIDMDDTDYWENHDLVVKEGVGRIWHNAVDAEDTEKVSRVLGGEINI